jgi:hypothetical protein
MPAHWTPVEAAAHSLVHEYRDGDKTGAEAMGPRIGKSPRLLSNEVNPDYEGAKLGLLTAVNIEREAGAADILHAHAQMLHHVCFALPYPDHFTGDVELLRLFADWQAALGLTCMEIQKSLEDNRITTDEVNAILRRGYLHMTRFMELLERFKELAE